MIDLFLESESSSSLDLPFKFDGVHSKQVDYIPSPILFYFEMRSHKVAYANFELYSMAQVFPHPMTCMLGRVVSLALRKSSSNKGGTRQRCLRADEGGTPRFVSHWLNRIC